jgi:hypothetical protein
MMAEYLPRSFVCVYTHVCVCVCIHRDPLFLIQPGGFNFTADGALMDARPFFPRSKVGKNIYLCFSFFDYLVAWLSIVTGYGP